MITENASVSFWLKTALPVMLGSIIAMSAAAAFVWWSAHETDRVSIERQTRLVSLVVSQLQAGIAHDQESVTVWDEAVENVRAGDLEWIDINMGSWMQSYFGHDAAFVLNGQRQPLYAYFDGAQKRVETFEPLRRTVEPMLSELQERLKAGDKTGISERVLSIGRSDIDVVDGHPAVVSIKPIVSDTGAIEQNPGDEALHVAVRYLDGSFLQSLKQDYMIDGLRFDWENNARADEASVELKDGSGISKGFFIWSPYRPSWTVLKQVAPAMAALQVGILLIIGIFLVSLRRRSLRLAASQAEVQHLAAHDQLTNLPNRRQFEAKVERELRELKNRNGKIAVYYLDLDRFKEVNDALGHPAGDEVLQQFADRLKPLIGPANMVARLGGDEFAIITPRMKPGQTGIALAEQIVEMARQPFSVAGTQAFIGVSVGIAIAPRHGTQRVDVTRCADVAMYQAKRSGRSSYAIYSPEMDKVRETRRGLERDLREALRVGGQLHLHYQPLYSAASSTITGVEALVRWHHPERGWLAPSVFIPIAEETDLIHQLGDWVLNEACQETKDWPIATVAVNVSALELGQPGYAARATSILMKTGANPRHLELEVTESALTTQGKECKQNIQALRELGVRFALDDFGTGFSSLSRLQQLDVDRIKIDRSFVHGFGKHSGDEAIVQAIVDLARASGLRTTAEGVETQHQSDELTKLGCDELQGFLFHKPVPASEIEKLWDVHRRAIAQ